MKINIRHLPVEDGPAVLTIQFEDVKEERQLSAILGASGGPAENGWLYGLYCELMDHLSPDREDSSLYHMVSGNVFLKS